MSALGRDAFVDRLRAIGVHRYHDKHPFHLRMHAGTLDQRALQGWVENRYYYQTRIPLKDALILSKSEDPSFRRAWIRRIVDHDGATAEEGGLTLWLRLAEGVGLDRDRVARCANVLPAVRFACDAYVTLVRERSLLEAVASSLTEFFAPDLMSTRIAAWETHYPWVDSATLAYFRGRVPRAKRDAGEALDFVLARATSEEAQEACARALGEKCDILWAMLDAIAGAFPDNRLPLSPEVGMGDVSVAIGPIGNPGLKSGAARETGPSPASPGSRQSESGRLVASAEPRPGLLAASSGRPRLARRVRVSFDVKEGRSVLLSPDRGLLLNEVAVVIVRALDGTRTLDEIAGVVGRAFPGADEGEVRKDVAAFLDELEARALLEGVRA